MIKHIVLDLDECCVHVYSEEADWQLYNTLQKPEHYAVRKDVFLIQLGIMKMWGKKRPHLDEFLTYCFQNYETVSVWSAGTTPYVEAVVAEIFRDFPAPNLILTREHTLKEYHYNQQKSDFYCKPLYVFFEYMPGANKTNTVLVDNQHSNSKYDPENILHVPDFLPEQTLEGMYADDDCFPLLIRWLETVKHCENDVREVFKGDIFLPTHEKLINDCLRGVRKLPVSCLMKMLLTRHSVLVDQ